ncbi:hypothetical protein J437_LFUL017102 [Ladona fulva]|uniref:tRNA-binding domain-containing protein n=1 Tax=Ladona fulva TaxID=123851 RepID=A0A8K0KI00_LADFU|nr:hypothetical protein J437_LFUL017102 [Ladona fulva]
MANKDVLSRLEFRAVEAQKLIEHLKSEIARLKSSKSEISVDDESRRLMQENYELSKEVEIWKERLIKAEIENGKVPIALPSVRTSAGTPLSSGNVEVANKESKQLEEPKPVVVKEKPIVAKEKPVQEKAKSKKSTENESKPKAKKENPEKVEEKIDVGRLDIRVGLIENVDKHPDADSLYVETVNLGSEKRTVVSGLVRFVDKKDLEGRVVVLLCNLKPAKMRGITSEAMVLCASTPEKVEVLNPPQGSAPGDIVIVDGFEHRPDPVLNPKKKVWETVAVDLKVNSNGIATYKGVPLTVSGKGEILAKSLTDVPIK